MSLNSQTRKKFAAAGVIVVGLTLLIQPHKNWGQTDLVSPFDPPFFPITNVGFKIPLTTVPAGNGLALPLFLEYKPNITLEDQASSTGQGWSFRPGAIIQKVNGIPDQDNLGWLNRGRKTDEQDFWFVVLGDARQPFRFLKGLQNASFTGDTPWKIEAHGYSMKDAATSVEYTTIQFFEITAENQMKYFFGPRRGNRDVPEWNGYRTFFEREDKKTDYYLNNEYLASFHCAPRPCKQIYNSIWELTEILGSDYVDANRNGFADLGDRGGWIRLSYRDYSCRDDERRNPADRGSPCRTGDPASAGDLPATRAYANGSYGWPFFFPLNQISWGPGKDLPPEWMRTSQSNESISRQTLENDVFLAKLLNHYPPDSLLGKILRREYGISQMIEIDFVLLAEVQTPTHVATLATLPRGDARIVQPEEGRFEFKLDRIQVRAAGSNEILEEVQFGYEVKTLPEPTDGKSGALMLKRIDLFELNGLRQTYRFEYKYAPSHFYYVNLPPWPLVKAEKSLPGENWEQVYESKDSSIHSAPPENEMTRY